jgi:hypothetical protein
MATCGHTWDCGMTFSDDVHYEKVPGGRTATCADLHVPIINVLMFG